MLPILILLNATNDWADYFEAYLIEHQRPYQLVNCGAGQTLPLTLDGYGGFAIMGGPMSANDEATVAHLRPAYDLLQQAIATRIPVIGHCLGGQMLAKALGGSVIAAPLREVGWHTIRPNATLQAREWLGEAPFKAMQWHYDAFTLPAHAVHLAHSDYCPNQAFVAEGIHLGMQFHIEARTEKISRWIADERSERSRPNDENIHGNDRVRDDTAKYEAQSVATARGIYARWLQGL